MAVTLTIFYHRRKNKIKKEVWKRIVQFHSSNTGNLISLSGTVKKIRYP